MYQTINGWTKAKMIQHIKDNFKGKSTEMITTNGTTYASCRYRTSCGKKCAVGLFIPENMYSFNFEGHNITNLLAENSELGKVLPLPLYMMNKLQHIHDCSKPEETLRNIVYWIQNHVTDEPSSGKV